MAIKVKGQRRQNGEIEEFLDIDAPKSAELTNDAMLNFRNSAGVVVFSVDLSDLGGSGAHFANTVISTNSLAINEESSGAFTVALSEAPGQNQPVYVAVSDNTKISVSPTVLTFTPQNWNTPQTVTVTALPDADSDDESETVTVTSRKATTKQIAVSVADITPEKVTNGLAMEFDFRQFNTGDNILLDTVGSVPLTGLAVKNGEEYAFNKAANGIYGCSAYKYAKFDDSDDAYTAFKNKMVAANTRGITIETFGLKLPGLGNTGNAMFVSTGFAAGYSANSSSNRNIVVGPTVPYIDNNGDPKSASGNNGNFIDDTGAAASMNESVVSFIQADIVINADGSRTVYGNGYRPASDLAAPEDFSAWDFGTAFTLKNQYTFGAWQLGADENYYLTFWRFYDRPLTWEEVKKNVEYNKASIGISDFT